MHDPDPRTVERARGGDVRAFEDLVRACQADIFRFALRLTRDRPLAEDVTQETFLRAFRFVGGYRGDQRFGSWLYAIARNCAMDALRRRGIPPPLLEPAEPVAPDVTARLELDAALDAVSPEHREAFLLVEVLGLSYQETADVLGVAVGTVKSRMFRARQALCRAIAGEEATS